MKYPILLLIIISLLSCKKEEVKEEEEIINYTFECPLTSGDCFEIEDKYVKDIEIFQVRNFTLTDEGKPFMIIEGGINFVRLDENLEREEIIGTSMGSGSTAIYSIVPRDSNKLVLISKSPSAATRISDCNYEGQLSSSQYFGLSENVEYKGMTSGNLNEYIIVGGKTIDAPNDSLVISKINVDKDKIWRKSIIANFGERLSTVVRVDAGFIAVGKDKIADESEIVFYSLDDNGENISKSVVELTAPVGGWITKAVNTSDAGFIIATASLDEAEKSDFFLLKFDSSGNLEWELNWGTPNSNLVTDIIESVNGGYFLIGSSFNLEQGQHDVHLFKISENGQILWEKMYYTVERDFSGTVYEDETGDLYITGATGEGVQLFVMKLDENGIPK